MSRPLSLVVMGVSGTGKTSVAERLASELGIVFIEGDSLHPQANVDKMTAGVALTDGDRWPWLATLAMVVSQHHAEGRSTVLTCSALRRAYRDVLRSRVADDSSFFVHLDAPADLLRERMERRDHFMPASLLASQFATLEPLQPDETGVRVDVSAPLDEVTRRVVELVLVWSGGRFRLGSAPRG